jgi:hypothetical protein
MIRWLVRHFKSAPFIGADALQSYDTSFADKREAQKYFNSVMRHGDVVRVEMIKVTYEHVRIWECTK